MMIGSCWAFSATEQIESDAMRQLGSTYVLSVNQMLQCALGGHVSVIYHVYI